MVIPAYHVYMDLYIDKHKRRSDANTFSINITLIKQNLLRNT